MEAKLLKISPDFEMALSVLVRGKLKILWDELRARFHSRNIFYGLRRDLTMPFAPPTSRIPLRIRLLHDSDIPRILDQTRRDMTAADYKDTLKRITLLKTNTRNCYVAVGPDDVPLFIQWLFTAAENEMIQKFFHKGLPPIGPDEVLLEGAFTPAHLRGQGIMPASMSLVAQKGAELGARWALTFISDENYPALKACDRAGFKPYLYRVSTWRFFQREIHFNRFLSAFN